jgi:hypothetical protein
MAIVTVLQQPPARPHASRQRIGAVMKCFVFLIKRAHGPVAAALPPLLANKGDYALCVWERSTACGFLVRDGTYNQTEYQ